MQKDFDNWNQEKKRIHEHGVSRLYHAREIWWCALGINVGPEQDGSEPEYRRPVLVLKGLSAETCLVIPLTTSRMSHPLRVSIGIVDGKQARALLSQMRVVDTKRLVRKIEYLDKEHFEEIRKAVRSLI